MATRGVVERDVFSACFTAMFPSVSERGVQPGAVKSGCCDILEPLVVEFATEDVDSLGFAAGTSIVTGVEMSRDVRVATRGEDGLVPASGT